MIKNALTCLGLLLAFNINAQTASKPDNFCNEFKAMLTGAKANFDSIKGDTIRDKKTTIFAAKISLTGIAGNRISYDKSIKQSFYRGFLEGTGNITVTKQKFDGLKNRIKACVGDSTWVEKNVEEEDDIDYTRTYTYLENPQDPVTKMYKGAVIEIEVEFNKTSDTEYDIMLTVTYY